MKVINGITEALDNKQCCLSLFIDFSKAFDTVGHDILTERLTAAGFSVHAVGWFANYLTDRSQAVQVEGVSSEVQSVHKGVPQVSVLGPLLNINNIGMQPFIFMLMTQSYIALDPRLQKCLHICRMHLTECMNNLF